MLNKVCVRLSYKGKVTPRFQTRMKDISFMGEAPDRDINGCTYYLNPQAKKLSRFCLASQV